VRFEVEGNVATGLYWLSDCAAPLGKAQVSREAVIKPGWTLR
jgi:hypothetical protein